MIYAVVRHGIRQCRCGVGVGHNAVLSRYAGDAGQYEQRQCEKP